VADAAPEGSPVRRDVDEIRRAAERGAALTRQLLILGRRDIASPRVLDVNRVVSELQSLLRTAVGDHVAIELRLTPDPWPVKVDAGQLEQVLLNLAVNSRDAMPKGGRLTIGTANVERGPDFARRHPGAVEGRFLRITVQDTGVGMEGEVARRSFEPFFTTKPKGEGTGLGLATVYGIVKNFGGVIELDSEVGSGTTFTVHLPAVASGAWGVRQDAAPAPSGGETVLVVEDEVAVQEMAGRILSSQGYSVLNAANGEEALEMSSRGDSRIDVLLTDVMMPGMLGTELARRITARVPDIRVLYISGYGHEAIEQQGLVRGARFVEKPFSPQDLLNGVRELLDAPARAGT
jgi:CheY-like chemotaxis protein